MNQTDVVIGRVSQETDFEICVQEVIWGSAGEQHSGEARDSGTGRCNGDFNQSYRQFWNWNDP